ncbi:MAG: GNVR domain-containing protein [Candidatus Omnitrophota bacterium]
MIEHSNANTLRYLRIFFRRREVFLAILFIMPLLVFNVSNFLPKIYSASTLIKINDERLLTPLIGDLAVSSTVQERLRSFEEEILTWSNLAAITKDLNLEKNIHSQIEYEQLIINMRKAIQVNIVSQDIIRITYRGKDPYEVKLIADSISDLFIQKNIAGQNDKADHATEFIANQLQVYQYKLDESERVFSRFRLLKDLNDAQSRKKLILEQLGLQTKDIVSQIEQRENPLVAEFRMQLIELEVELANLLVDATENHPRVRQIRADISKTKEQLHESIKNPQAIETRTPNPVYQDLERQEKNIDFEISKIKAELSQVESLNDKYEAKALPEQELASLARDNRVNEHLYETLLARLETANITKRLEDSKSKTTFEIIEKARLPLKPMSPTMIKIIFSALIISLMSAVGVVMGLEYLDTSFKNTNEIQEFLGKPALGAIPGIYTVQDVKSRKNRLAIRWGFLMIFLALLASTGIYFYIN